MSSDSSSEQKRLAQDHFGHWFGEAKDSFFMYEQALKSRKYKKAAFELHQATEACCKAILLVFTNYNPQEHYLVLLGQRAEKYGCSLSEIFPRETEGQKELFNLLDHAYIGARYDPEYKITKKQLEQLAKYVRKLQRLTKKICKEKIESFT